MICDNVVFFRVLFIKWVVFRGKFRIKDVWVNWNVVFDMNCELCGDVVEIFGDFFFVYFFLRLVWEEILGWMGIRE